MTTTIIKAIVRQGRLDTENPINLPDGTELLIPLTNGQSGDETEVDKEDDRPLTQEEIDLALAAMERMEPFTWTDKERDAWEAERRSRKEWPIAGSTH